MYGINRSTILNRLKKKRFWRFFNQKFRANRDFETLKKFREETYDFLENLKAYRQALRSSITDNFQILDARIAFSWVCLVYNKPIQLIIKNSGISDKRMTEKKLRETP